VSDRQSVDIFEVKVAERALNLEAISSDCIAMGAARNNPTSAAAIRPPKYPPTAPAAMTAIRI
jgi:hypothetical protein